MAARPAPGAFSLFAAIAQTFLELPTGSALADDHKTPAQKKKEKRERSQTHVHFYRNQERDSKRAGKLESAI